MTALKIIDSPSLNYDDRREGADIRYLILHYTGMASSAEALARLRDPDAKVSAHYLIGESGEIHRLVPEEKRAWHAGVSSWEGEDDINSFSIGVELVNPGHDYPGYKGDYRPFPAIQMETLAHLSRQIIERHHIKPWHVLGHSDVAPARKIDPGELFDWQWLAGQGIGLWPAQGTKEPLELRDLQQALLDYGYGIEVTGREDEQTRLVLSAFQRHFRPGDFSGKPDGESRGLLKSLLQVKQKDVA
ncbi:N-acetylmuramoyl-L-alanine amidase [Emcibacter sp.]|uniref:N-acetylmuramoyl-L-alanine amidase n=1 Tax=Emcibacter sp. TaxID=1979954 RepID=UPI002AA90860|nr:N-acetylmuramoyl-L-alanine amidase [Emcibacter sp.]